MTYLSFFTNLLIIATHVEVSLTYIYIYIYTYTYIYIYKPLVSGYS